MLTLVNGGIMLAWGKNADNGIYRRKKLLEKGRGKIRFFSGDIDHGSRDYPARKINHISDDHC